MVIVEFYGIYRLNYKLKSVEIEAKTVMDLLKKLEQNYGVYTAKELKNSIIIVNDVNFVKLKKYRTPLKNGDKILIMSPASGG